MRGRIDVHPGLWPAFWTLGSTGTWPAAGEIDIFEVVHRLLKANVAWSGKNHGAGATWNSVTRKIQTLPADWSSQFHIWRMDWDDNQINLYVDDQLMNHTDLKDTTNDDEQHENPFHHPQYLILNFAVGASSAEDEPSHTEFPARFEVDYVRVYQKARQ